MKAVVAAFNQEKALVGAFSVITNLRMQFGWNFLKHYMRTLARQEFAVLLRAGRLAHLLDSNMVHMNWVPVVLGTEVRAGLCAFK